MLKIKSSPIIPRRKPFFIFVVILTALLLVLRYSFITVNDRDSRTFVYSIMARPFNFDQKSFHFAYMLLDTQTFSKNPVTMESKETLPGVVPVMAISSNHFDEFKDHLPTIQRFFPNVKVVLFDLGLIEDHIKAVRNMPFVEHRKVDFSNYPPHVGVLKLYAWKVFIIQETLAEFEAIIWLDASVELLSDISPAVDQMVAEKSGFLFFNEYGKNKVIGVTEPDMIDYLPVVNTTAIRTNHMEQANGMIIFNTLQVQRKIMKWAVLCALDRNCIAPLNTTGHCPPEMIGSDHFIGCHRYDQSLFNVLAGNANNFELDKYVFKGERFSKVERYLEPNDFGSLIKMFQN